jgi:hypothetical protein
MKILEKLFGGVPRVKIMRMFLFNPEIAFDVHTIADRSKVSLSQVRKEVAALYDMGLVRKRSVIKHTPSKSKHGESKKKKVDGWILDTHFTYINELQQLVLNTTLIKNSDIVKRLQKSGKMKLILLSGLFIQNPDSRLDMFVVGDGIKKGTLENAVKIIESEIGKELRYVWFNTEEFKYRLAMYDKLVRDMLDFPHEKILNKVNI